MTKRVFITGTAGFIGFHTALALKQNQHEVLGFDNFNDYYSVALKRERAARLKDRGIETLEADLVDQEALKQALEQFKPTHVIHLAAQAGVRYSLKNPDAYIQSNIIGFTNLLELLKKTPEVPLIYASSSSVYGDTEQVPFSEQNPTDTPINLYGATKKANELMAYAYHSLYKNRMIGLRFFTVYGPWGRPDMAYFLFAEKIQKGLPITVYQGEKIQRDFTYIDDIVDGILKALDCKLSYEVFNLGNNQPVKLNTFIENLEEVLGKKALKDYRPRALGDMEKTYADLTKSQSLLGYAPKVDLKAGLSHFARWFEEEYQAMQITL